MTEAFADRLIRRARELAHPLCAGLDPHLPLIPPLFRRGSMEPGAKETADAVSEFCHAMLDRLAGKVVCIKPQSAFFEALGWRGVEVLDRVLRAARERELLVILDAKRGDIGSTAAGYASAYLGPDAPMAADALTVNPYLGSDSLEPFIETAASGGAGLFVLVKTSNPGSGDFQDLQIEGDPLYARVAGLLDRLAPQLVGPETGWSGLGAVVGATYPETARRARRAMPRNLILVPGYGAQGGEAEAAVASFVPGPTGQLEGGVVSSSRGILFPEGSEVSEALRWEEAIDSGINRAAAELRAATRA